MKLGHARIDWSSRAKVSGLLLIMTAMVVAGTAPACSSSTGGHAAPAPAPGASHVGASAHAIHVMAVRPDGTRKQLDFGQGTEIAYSSSQATSATSGSGVHKLDFSPTGPFTSPPTVGSPDDEIQGTAWALVERAAIECDTLGDFLFVTPTPWSVVPELAQVNWLVYSQLGFSCSQRLYTEQNMLCIADKLAEIGDAVGTVVFPSLLQSPRYEGLCQADAGTAPFTFGSGNAPGASAGRCDGLTEWDVPPQADRDRFIVRDLAIHILGNLASLDASPVFGCNTGNNDPSSCLCPTMFTDVINGSMPIQGSFTIPAGLPLAGSFQTNSEVVFGTSLLGSDVPVPLSPAYPPSDLTIVEVDANSNVIKDNSPIIARSALQVEAQILRGAGRLLHDLIRRDVYSDLAAAAQQSAKALDPDQGNLVAWGEGPQGPYGTYAHAARVLAGRWEIGDTPDKFNGHGDPTCVGSPGITAIDILPQAFGPELSARVQDRPIRTQGEALAASLVAQAGVVLPTCVVAAAAPSSLRAALVDQLLLQEQIRNNLTPNPQASQRAVFDRVAQGATDAELLFGYGYVLRTYRLLTDSDDETDPSSCMPMPLDPVGSVAGLKSVASNAVAPSVAALQGVVVDGGLDRSRLTTEPIARSGGILEASECSEEQTASDDFGVAGSDPFLLQLQFGNPSPTPEPALPRVVFQDSFHIGQAIERRLIALQTASAAPAVVTGSPTDAEAVARGAIAELRSWAGSAIVRSGGQSSANGSLAVQVDGMDYATLGLNAQMPQATREAAIAAAFGFVFGPPWVAECAAHVRGICPPNFDTTWVQHASVASDTTGTSSGSTLVTTDGIQVPTWNLSVPFLSTDAGRVVNFAPTLNASLNLPQSSRVYMVLLRDPSSPGGQGRVLGTIPTQWAAGVVFGGTILTNQFSSFVDAPMQRELLDASLNTGKWVGEAPPRIGDPSAGMTSGYCIDGVPRNLFVPLQNELTADDGQSFENSWKHYLAVAKQAATTADTLAQDLLQNNLKIEEDKQAADEQLADLCGDFAAVSKVTTQSDGHIVASASDPTLQACLGEPTVDVVFFGQIPVNASGNPVVDCSPGGADPTTYLRGVLQCSGNGKSDPLCSKVDPATGNPKLTCAALGIRPPATPQPTVDCSSIGTAASTLRTNFTAQTLSTTLRQDPFSDSNMTGVVAGLAMTVNNFDDWTVTYQGLPIMDSTSTTLWPGCLNNSGGCGTNASAQVKTLNALYRWCPGVTDANALLTTALGCDPPANDTIHADAVRAELNILRWRVAGSLMLAAAAAGKAPGSLFTMPVPVAMFGSGAEPTSRSFIVSGTYQGLPTNNNQPLTGTDAVTGQSVTLQGYKATGGGLTNSDIAQLRTMYDVPAAFSFWPSGAGPEVPDYYFSASTPSGHNSLYAGGAALSALRHTDQRANAEFVFPHCETANLAGLPPGPDCAILASTTVGSPSMQATLLGSPIGLSTMFDMGSTDINGLACPSSPSGSGNANGLTTNQLNLIHVVASAKTDYEIPGNDKIIQTQSGCGFFDFSCAMSAHWVGPKDQCFSAPKTLEAFPPDIQNDGTCVPWDTPNWYDRVSNVDTSFGLTGSTWSTSDATVRFVNKGFWTPTDMSPENRVRAFVNSGGADGLCGAAAQIVQAAGLTCIARASVGTLPLGSPPPPITKLSDVALLESWLSQEGRAIQASVSGLYVENIPQRVLDDFQNGTVGTGDKSGQYGANVLQTEEGLNALPGLWAQLGADLQQISDAITTARLAVTAADVTADTTLVKLTLEQMQAQAAMTQADASLFGAFTSAISGAASTDGLSFLNVDSAFVGYDASSSAAQAELNSIAPLTQETLQLQQNQSTQALTALDQTTSTLWANAQTTAGQIRTTVGNILIAEQAAQLTSSKAQYQAAIGTGADFVNIAGENVDIPVNTVLQRQLNGTEIRYQRALINAKALAYMARRAIEQRLGVPLSAITTRVGPLDAPASWADDICSLTGVDLTALDSGDAGQASSAANQQISTQFADSFVGDYVDKLQNFVDYFNVQYPSHEADDTAVLSLRSDLLPPVSQCSALAPNLLLNSGHLDVLLPQVLVSRAIARNPSLPPAAAPVTQGLFGWDLPVCPASASRCLTVSPGIVLASPQDGPFGPVSATSAAGGTLIEVASGVSWLSDVAQTPSVADGGAEGGASDAGDAGAKPDAGDAGKSDAGDAGGVSDAGDAGSGADAQSTGPVPSAAPGLLYQAVTLVAGNYLLSWWDQARDSVGNLPAASATPPKYIVRVFDRSGAPLAAFQDTPFVPGGANAGSSSLWSARRVLAFTATQPGIYQVAFGASTADEGLGSVAIADVQLEVAQTGSTPSPYVDTTSSRTVTAYNCPPTDSDLRSAFQHNCDSTGLCWFDLTTPLIINTEGLNQGGSPLAGKLARGNFNYRHINVAVNLVGTGVRDCTQTPTPDCFGTGYIEYTLEHDGTNAGITDYNGKTRVFDFGIADIQHGKALAAERYITMPLGTADSTLLSQPGIQHVELRGRPLDGVYRLRIWDTPSLHWGQLQDIQILVNYRYWSEIVANGTASGQGQ